jgi:hypothetical protein
MLRHLRAITLIAFALLMTMGCTSDGPSRDGDVRQRQDAALKDPFSYGPAEHDPKKGKPAPADSTPENKGTAKSDWDRFWNP